MHKDNEYRKLKSSRFYPACYFIVPICVTTLLFMAGAGYSGTVTGKVKDSEYGTPLHLANVQFEDMKTGGISNTAGEFCIDDISSGKHRISASFVGYNTVTKEIYVPEKGDVYVVFELIPYAMPMGEMVVTGSRVQEKIRETPVTINVVSNSEMETLKYRNAGEVLKRIPSVYTHNFHGEEELTSIRIPTHFVNPYTLLLVDGLPVTNYGKGGGGLLRGLNSDNIERIEIVKGPASAIYGSNAIGGVINVISRKPTSIPRVRLWSEYGNYEDWRGGLSLGGTKGGYDMNFNLNFINAEGWRENSGHEKAAGTLKLRRVLGGSSLLIFNLEYVDFDNELSGSIDKEDYDDDWQQSYNTFTAVKMKKWFPSLTYRMDLRDSEFRASVIMRSMDHEVNPNYGIRYNSKTRGYSSYLSEIDGIDLDLQLLYRRNIELLRSKIIGGVDLEEGRTRMDEYGLSVERDDETGKYTSFEVTGLDDSYDISTEVIAPYLQYSASPLELLRINVGGRYDRVKYGVGDRLDQGRGGIHNFSNFTPKAGLTLDVSESVNCYANYSHGFVTPTTSQLFTGSVATRDLDPERAKNVEAGVRSHIWDRRMAIELAAYDMSIEDKIIIQTIDPVTYAREYRNVGETSHRGIEASLSIAPLDIFRLSLAYTFAENKYKSYEDRESGINFNGNWMPRSPRHRLNARFGLVDLKGFDLELEMNAEGEQYADDENDSPYSCPTLYDLRASYDFLDWSLWAHATNLTDRKYATYVNESYGSLSYYPGSPRTVFAGISYKWCPDTGKMRNLN